MDVNSIKNYRLLQAFVNGFVDKITTPYKSLKAVNTLCRKAIEEHLSQSPDIKNLIFRNKEHGAWIKEIIINYTILTLQAHALLWEINEHEPHLQEILKEKV